MTDSSVAITVVIPTHNRSDALTETLSQLSKQSFNKSWEAVVVNNRSTDDTDDVVRRQNFPVSLKLVHEDVPGPAAARNTGAAAARGDFLLFIDNDILVEPDFVGRHYDALVAHRGSWIVGQVVNLPEQQRTPFGRYRKHLYPFINPEVEASEAPGVWGANLSLPRTDLERLGGFDETFAEASVEDLDLGIRARQIGIKILFVPGIVGIHNDWAGSSIRDYCLRQRLYSRAEPLFWRKYGAGYHRANLVTENLPPAWRHDSPRMLFRKIAKQCVGTPLGQSMLMGACGALERTWPWPPVLWRLYRFALAGAIYRGVQEGFTRHNVNGDIASSRS